MTSDPFDPLGLFTEPATAAAAAGVTKLHPSKTYVTKTGKTVHIPVKTKGTLDKTTRKAIKLVVEHNVEPKDAWELVNGKTPTVAAVANLKAKCSEYSLQTDEMQRLASRVVKNTLKGKPMVCERTTIDRKTGQVIDYTDNQYPSHTNMLAAASMVQDRVDPIVRQNINLNGNLADFLPFELDKYR